MNWKHFIIGIVLGIVVAGGIWYLSWAPAGPEDVSVPTPPGAERPMTSGPTSTPFAAPTSNPPGSGI